MDKIAVDAHYRSIVDDEVIQVSLTKTAIDFLPKICAIDLPVCQCIRTHMLV